MTVTIPHMLQTWSRSRELLASAFERGESARERGIHFCKAIQGLWPAQLYACLLNEDSRQHITVLDESGTRRADWEPLLGPSLVEWSRNGRSEGIELPPVTGLTEHWLWGSPIGKEKATYGTLALALPREQQNPHLAASRGLLAHCAHEVGWQFHLEACRDQGNGMDSEKAALLTRVSEMTSLVTHEFNNYLNGILLHVAILEQRAAETARAELQVIKRLGRNAATMIKRLQQLNRQETPQLGPMDLNEAIREASRQFLESAPGVKITLQLASGLPEVRASAAHLNRLLKMLLAHSSAVVGPTESQLTVRTEQATNGVALYVQDNGPAVDSELLPRLFEPFVSGRPGGTDTDLAICKAIVRRLQGNIHAENLQGGGFTFILQFTHAEDS